MQTQTVVALADFSPQTPLERYVEMKAMMPMEKLVVTTRRFNPELSEEEVLPRADALAQWLASIPEALKEGRWFQMIETIDVVWHSFILHTKDYADFCQHFYGGFLHHDPPMDFVEDRTAYADYTLNKIRRAFGDQINPLLEDLSADVKCCFRYIVE